ncbi:hypothetical protein CP981_09035 [Streptomyces platensis]|uniref:Uncharacterized protein n=3 Tax=Streptomyces TaxID=1883 RepID=A0AAE6TLN3_STRPT|nr:MULTISPECIES: hypothetical protein [Streptomyces]OSY39745.1 hypothetical protein BG653_05664 [Streptomyces platensis]QEV51782.1 hypothetical protein CP981_09035 [Streptomyces platensis]GFE17785.1 hypothetical protein Sgleb_58320 [Streptomyces glebosus]GHG84292.1 hypothetical protein GCM10010513_64390 [Streptomyces glebosus]
MSAVFRRSSAPGASRLRTRLPWWALALPVVSFIALLALVVGSPEASAASARQGLAPLLRILAQLLHGAPW